MLDKDIPIKGLEKIQSQKEGTPNMEPVVIPEKPGLSFGIEETQEVVDFGISLANAVIKSLADGKVGFSDIPNFVSPVFKLPKALSGIDKVPYELNDIQPEELEQLKSFVKANLDVADEKAKEIIDNSLLVLYDIHTLVKVVKS